MATYYVIDSLGNQVAIGAVVADLSQLNASNLTSGTVPLARLVGITNAQIDAAAAIAYSKLSLTGSIVNADINASAAIAYSKLNLTGNIVNADINASAAIAYSKLNLATSIVNGDVSASAAIAYSKLNLSGSVVNADISNSAAIAYSKLNLATSIVNGDVSASAAIAWSKISKSGSSLADLATRSAGDLSSGTIPDARIPGFTSDGSSRIEQLAFKSPQVQSSDANTLDDYVEGTWTPVLGGAGGTSGQTYSVQVGKYTKVGRMIYANASIALSAKGTITGNLQIQGLPVASVGVDCTFAVLYINLVTTWVNVIAYMAAGGTTADIRGATAAATGNFTNLTTTDVGNTTNIGCVFVYPAAT